MGKPTYVSPLIGALQQKYWKCGCTPSVRGIGKKGEKTKYTPLHMASCPKYGNKAAQRAFEENYRKEEKLLAKAAAE